MSIICNTLLFTGILANCALTLNAATIPIISTSDLAVPFKAQYPPGTFNSAQFHGKEIVVWDSHNCGPTAVLMVLNYYGQKAAPTAADILDADVWLAGNIKGYAVNGGNGSDTDTGILVRLAREKYSFEDSAQHGTFDGWTVDSLVTELSNGHPLVVAVKTNMGTRGNDDVPHFMVLRGIAGGKVYVNDPGHAQGQDVSRYTLDEFKVAWASQHNGVVVIHPNGQPPLVSTFTETFNNAPDNSNNWVVASQSGSFTTTYTPGNFRIQAPPVCTAGNGGTGIIYRSKQGFVGDLDVSFQLNHGGFGRTLVGLWSVAQNQVVIQSILDTDDTNYLDFLSGASDTAWKYAGTPYMNRWVTLRIQVVGNQVNFYADGALLQTWPVPVSSPPDAYNLAFGAASVCWKSGANDTSFRLIQATGIFQ